MNTPYDFQQPTPSALALASGSDCLMEIILSANIPSRITDEQYFWQNIIYPAKDGWQVEVFFDGDEMDYVENLIDPQGRIVDFWPLEGDEWDKLRWWRV